MSKLFAKYLPIEGEIKKGMKYILTKSLGLGAYTEGYTGTAAIDFTKEAQECQGGKILKLFLCSRDIQVGDRATEKLAIGEYEEFQIDTENDIFPDMIVAGNQFKIIGEISSEAIWVKEGDEFDEDQVFISKLCRDTDANWQYACAYCGSKRECRNDEGDMAKIKGQCGHFH